LIVVTNGEDPPISNSTGTDWHGTGTATGTTP